MEGYTIYLPSTSFFSMLTNTFIARLVLNFKGLDYKTEWVEYPDVAPKFKELGIPPNPKDLNPNFEYSIPAVKINGEYIMDSLAIAKKIEEIQPEPSLHIDSEYTKRTQDAVLQLLGSLAPIAMPRVPPMLLNPPSAQYFEETRAKRFGMPLAEFAKSDKAKNAWENAQPALEEIKAILNDHKDWPNVLGDKFSFADFILAGLWRFVELLDKDGDLYGKIMKFDTTFEKHYYTCKRFMDKTD